MKKKLGKAFGIFVVVAALVVLANSAFVIRENQYGLVRQFGRIERVISDSGLYFKIPFIQEKDTPLAAIMSDWVMLLITFLIEL